MISRKRALEILNRSTGDDRVSRICDHFLAALILLNLLAVSLESIDTLGDKYARQFFWFEIFSVTIFGIEYVLRIWAVADNESSRYKTALGRRFDYIFSFTGLIDLAAILPSILPLFMGQVDLRWLRVLRLLRHLCLQPSPSPFDAPELDGPEEALVGPGDLGSEGALPRGTRTEF